jgi:hypothetical protein
MAKLRQTPRWPNVLVATGANAARRGGLDAADAAGKVG